MINLRFHIVSLVAVFLALAIGILTGSTLLDRATIEVLEDRQASLDRRNSDLHDELELYKQNTDRRDRALAEFGSGALPDLVPGLLTDEPLIVFAARGVDNSSVVLLQQLLSDAGATPLGTVWFDRRLDLTDSRRRDAVAQALGIELSPSSDAQAAVNEVTSLFAEALVTPTPDPAETGADAGADTSDAEGAGATDPNLGEPEGSDGAAVPPGADATDPDVDVDADPDGEDARTAFELLAALRSAELIDWVDIAGERTSIDAFPAGRVRVVVLSGEGAELDNAAFVQPLVRSFAALEPGLLFGEVHVPRSDTEQIKAATHERRGMVVDFVRDDAALAGRVVTVDNVEEPWGRLASVLAMSGVRRLDSGAYGVGASADQVLPDAEG